MNEGLGDADLLAMLCRQLAQVIVALDAAMERCRVCTDPGSSYSADEPCAECVDATQRMWLAMMCVAGWYAAGLTIAPRDLLQALIRGGHVERLCDALRGALERCGTPEPCARCTVGLTVLARMAVETGEVISALRARN